MPTKKERKSAETKSREILKKGKRVAISIRQSAWPFSAFLFSSLFPSSTWFIPPWAGLMAGAALKSEKQEVVLYFSDKNELFLVPEKRYVYKKGKEHRKHQAKRTGQSFD